MSFLMVFGAIVAGLFALVYMTKRRFGVLALALAAGASMSRIWVGDVTPIAAQAGLASTTQLPLENIVAAVLIVLPAVVLLIAGPTYRRASQRLFGALLFALLASVLLLEPFGQALAGSAAGQSVVQFLSEYTIFVVTICMVIALLDILAIKTPKTKAKH